MVAPVMDGITDDTAAIQALLNAKASTGGVVELEVGTALVSAALTLPSRVTLKGKNQRATVLLAAAGHAGSVLALENVNNAAIQDIGITGASTALGSRAVHGVHMSGCADCSIEHVWIDGKFTWGAYIQASSNSGLSHCVIDGSQQAHGVEINAAAGTSPGSNNCFVEFTTIRNTLGNNVEIYTQNPARVFGSRVEGCTLLGQSSAGQGSNIAEFGGVGTKIIGNTLRSAKVWAILIAGSEVNTSLHSVAALIQGNHIFDAGNWQSGGILISEQTAGCKLDQNTFTGNGISGQGIYIQGKDHSVTNNSVNGQGWNGIYAQRAIRPVITGNYALDNSAFNVGQSSGIALVDCSGAIVKGNQCHDTRGAAARQRHGIVLTTTLGALLEGNQHSGHTSHGIYNSVSGGGGSLLVNNMPNNGVTVP